MIRTQIFNNLLCITPSEVLSDILKYHIKFVNLNVNMISYNSNLKINGKYYIYTKLRI